MTPALTDMEQDQDAEYVRDHEPGLYAKIERRIQDGLTPEQINEWFDWPDGSKFTAMCLNTAHSLCRRERPNGLAKAKAALKKASDK